MTVWRTDSIDVAPNVTLVSWTLYELEDGSRHFSGYNVLLGEGRVSSCIQEFDPTTRIGRTRSGRLYQLVGDRGYNSDAAYVWNVWCNINGINSDSVKDISKEV